jgi:hypothetical protein
MTKNKKYPYEVAREVDKIIPKPISEAMNKLGWNAFGIYEIVKATISKNKKINQSRTKQMEI